MRVRTNVRLCRATINSVTDRCHNHKQMFIPPQFVRPIFFFRVQSGVVRGCKYTSPLQRVCQFNAILCGRVLQERGARRLVRVCGVAKMKKSLVYLA